MKIKAYGLFIPHIGGIVKLMVKGDTGKNLICRYLTTAERIVENSSNRIILILPVYCNEGDIIQ